MATFILLTWPLVAAITFFVLGRAGGLIWSCLTGYLFLPSWEAFDPPLLPAYNKEAAISFGLLLGAAVTVGQGSKLIVADKAARLLLISLIFTIFVGLVGTALTNTQPLVRHGLFQPGHSMRDLFSMTSFVVIVTTPYLLACRWLTDPKNLERLLFAIVALALLYSLFVIFEARMSPQLNRWVYGFFPSSFLQHIRGGAFRPVVFLDHGLSVGFFLLIAILSACTLARLERGKKRVVYVFGALWLLIVLVISRNLGSTMLAAIFAPLVLFSGRKKLMWLAMCCSSIFILYPAVRDSLPTDRFVKTVSYLSVERARSFEFRLDNEDRLIAHAQKKPVFGWGVWGRNRVVDEKGHDISITDGAWIIQFGITGWIGYISFFGLFVAPIFLLLRRPNAPVSAIGIMTILTVALINFIPNYSITPFLMLIAGALAGYVQYGVNNPEQETKIPANVDRMAFTRFGPNSGNENSSTYRRNHQDL